MKDVPIFRFRRLADWKPGCGFGTYVGRTFKLHGRDIILEAINANPKDLQEDPWDFDCGDPPEQEV